MPPGQQVAKRLGRGIGWRPMKHGGNIRRQIVYRQSVGEADRAEFGTKKRQMSGQLIQVGRIEVRVGTVRRGSTRINVSTSVSRSACRRAPRRSPVVGFLMLISVIRVSPRDRHVK
ncbi:hypothetical protein SODG_002701 [Sodalis praecaptivus]